MESLILFLLNIYKKWYSYSKKCYKFSKVCNNRFEQFFCKFNINSKHTLWNSQIPKEKDPFFFFPGVYSGCWVMRSTCKQKISIAFEESLLSQKRKSKSFNYFWEKWRGTKVHLFGTIRSLVVWLPETTVALKQELVLVNRPHLINSYEVGITAGPSCLLCSSGYWAC